MATRFTLNQLSTTWEVKLINCVSGTPFDPNKISTVSIVFTKSDGTKFSKAGTLEDDNGGKKIQYRNIPSQISILDLLGSWSYAGAGVLTDGGNFRTSEIKIFWVVP